MHEIIPHQRDVKQARLPVGQRKDFIFSGFFQLTEYLHGSVDRALQHFGPPAVVITDGLFPVGKLPDQLLGRLYDRPAFVLHFIPFSREFNVRLLTLSLLSSWSCLLSTNSCLVIERNLDLISLSQNHIQPLRG